MIGFNQEIFYGMYLTKNPKIMLKNRHIKRNEGLTKSLKNEKK